MNMTYPMPELLELVDHSLDGFEDLRLAHEPQLSDGGCHDFGSAFLRTLSDHCKTRSLQKSLLVVRAGLEVPG